MAKKSDERLVSGLTKGKRTREEIVARALHMAALEGTWSSFHRELGERTQDE